MIVEPGFLDHWKTRMLCDTLADPCAPLYVLRIWEHCQMRRKWVFDVLPSAALKALCRYNGHANQLESALVASGFVRRDEDGSLTALKWDEYNASLVANWDNGAKGGRPPKRGKITQSKPTENPSETHGLPMANPPGTEKRREDERREEGSVNTPSPISSRSPFDQVFDEYPPNKRPSATHARLFWYRENLDQHAPAILAALRAAKSDPKWVKTYAPRIDRWLEGRPWEAPQPEPEDPRAKRDGESDAEYSLRILKMEAAHAV